MATITQSRENFPNIREFHSSQFDEEILFAREFAQALNPEVVATPFEKISVVPPEIETDFREVFGLEGAAGGMFVHGNWYGEHNSDSVVVVYEDTKQPHSDKTRLIRCLTHEAVHSMTYTPKVSYGRFWAEVIAGFGELEILRHLESIGERVLTEDTRIIRHGYGDAITRISVPAELRSVDGRDAGPQFECDTTASSLGAHAVEMTMELHGQKITGPQLIKLSKPYQTTGRDIIKYVLGALDSDLPPDIDALPQFEGESHLRAAYLIQKSLDLS